MGSIEKAIEYGFPRKMIGINNEVAELQGLYDGYLGVYKYSFGKTYHDLSLINKCFEEVPCWEDVKGKQREQVLMETALRVYEIYTDLLKEGKLDKDKIDYYGSSYDLLLFFTDIAREYEEKYYGAEDWIWQTQEYATEQIMELFKIDEEV